MADNILVRWESEDGWREGVLCCVINDSSRFTLTTKFAMRESIITGCFGKAVIWDRYRNQPAIVPLGQVRLIEPRCPRCDGEGVVDAVATTGNGQGTAYRCKTTCECQRVPNAS